MTSTNDFLRALNKAASDTRPNDSDDAPKDVEFREALRARLARIGAKPMTARTLMELEQTARLAREMLAVERQPDAFPRQPGLSANSGSGYDGVTGVSYPSVSPGFYSAETFGAAIVREAIATMQQFMKAKEKPSTVELVNALAAAKKAGLDDIACKLEQRLDSASSSVDKPKSEKKNDATNGTAGVAVEVTP